jgi:hypothetical protein
MSKSLDNKIFGTKDLGCPTGRVLSRFDAMSSCFKKITGGCAKPARTLRGLHAKRGLRIVTGPTVPAFTPPHLLPPRIYRLSVRDLSTAHDGSRRSPSCSAQDDNFETKMTIGKLYSSNIGTWRWSSVGPRLGRRVAPITASTVSDSRAVRGTKMRCVFERWSGGLTR